MRWTVTVGEEKVFMLFVYLRKRADVLAGCVPTPGT